VLDHAGLVTDLPGWPERALALGIGVGAVVVGVRLVRAPVRQPA
jgi:hypothetical protein